MHPVRFVTSYSRALRAAMGRGVSFPAAVRSILRARFRYEVGPVFHSIFELDQKPESTWSEYISSYEANRRHQPLSSRRAKKLTTDKLAFHRFCVENGLSTAPILCVLDQGSPPHAGGSHGAPHRAPPNAIELETWEATLASAPEKLFVKPLDGIKGQGTFVVDRVGPAWRFLGREGSLRELHAHCMENIVGARGWLVQPRLAPHDALREALSPGALATIRVVTCHWSEEVTLLRPLIRIPTGDNHTDNFERGTLGNLIAPIDQDTGRLGRAFGSRSSRWPVFFSTDTHPDTGARITGFEIPYWQEAMQLVRDAQRKLCEIPTLGWDVAIMPEGPMLIEANWNYATEMMQVTHRRGVRSELLPPKSFERARAAGAVNGGRDVTPVGAARRR